MRFLRKVLSDLKFWLITAAVLAFLFKDPAIGLLIGAFLGLGIGNPCRHETGKVSKLLLQIAVSLLGFSMGLAQALQVGASSAVVTFISIGVTLLLGMLICKAFGIHKELAALLSGGTAICGGSAIAAFSSSMKATHVHTAVAMAVIFLLNGVALILFPPIGHLFNLTQTQFGYWAALAIHDTSSVVGAGAAYGDQAAAVATVVKLTRALWIIPLSLILAKMNGGKGKLSVPIFLVGFLAAAALRSLLPQFEPVWHMLAHIGKKMMVASLFLIGGGLATHDLREIGHRPLTASFLLWVVVSVLTLVAVKFNLMPELPL